ncbi:ATP-binding protein [Streptomyces sp. NPDC057798]|uniref:ATP-binding protein n=1 Tax=Streptomyces sp. NPDC057798 TaxID=3346252 RepID=UPI0036A65FE0
MAPAYLTQQTGIRSALDLCIERRPDPDDAEALSQTDAAWPKRLRRIVRASLTYWRQPDLIEAAELLLTELVTNALRHGRGPQIGVRICLRSGHLEIEVNDGSPARPELRHAAYDDETGRGLFLVASMADAWGVSDDGTTTWCTLPLDEGLPSMQLAPPTAPVLDRIPLDLPAGPHAARLARLQARTLLTVLEWPGDQSRAIDVLHLLIDNAVEHGHTAATAGHGLGAFLSVTEAHELIIDVTDPDPTFPDFDKALAGERGRSLEEIAGQDVVLSWFASPASEGKTVRAVLRPGPVQR